MIIAIDGPAAAGKSTVAREVARRLGLVYLDTGAMYRAVTLAVLERGLDPGSAEACGRVARELALSFDASGRIQIDGRPGEPRVRGEAVTRAVSQVSAHPEVRAAIVAQQRAVADRLGRDGGLVAEGRDTTTVVFPRADHKFFLIASEAERARRRARELEGREPADPARVQAVQSDLSRRDRLDSSRELAPLTRAPDAVLLDSDSLSADQVVERILREVSRGAVGGRGDA